jgi:hypothetical protein
MMYMDNALAVWIAPSGVIPGVLLFELVSVGTAWLIVLALLASVCGLLWTVTAPLDVLRQAGRRRRRLRIAPPRAKRRPEPQHA